MELIRKCPICNSIILYKHEKTFIRACENNTKCISCVGKLSKHDNFRGHHHTKESNRLKSEKMKGIGYGRKLSDETKLKISINKKGQASRTGAVLSQKTKDKIRESVLARKYKHSDETKQKLREQTIRLRKENPTKGISKSETQFLDILQEILNIKIERHYEITTKEYDGRYKNILFEVDGEYWHNKTHHKENDVTKNDLANANGYILFRFIVNEVSEINNRVLEYDNVIKNIKRLLNEL